MFCMIIPRLQSVGFCRCKGTTFFPYYKELFRLPGHPCSGLRDMRHRHFKIFVKLTLTS